MPTDSILVEFDVPATMRDGTVLRANVYRPAGDGRWPVLLTRLPYGKDVGGGTSSLDAAQAARRGYVVIVQDTRGRFASDGDWYPFKHEGADGFDTIAWAASLPYVDGQVGMYGGSYLGFTQWSAAVLQPPALKAIAPTVTWCDPTHGQISRGGAFELGKIASWHLRQGMDVLARRHRGDPSARREAALALARAFDTLPAEGYWSLPLADFAPIARTGVAPAFFDDLAGHLDPAHLAPRMIVGKHDRVIVPSFNIGGWYDIFLADTIANFQAMCASGLPAKLLIGPWTHGGQRNPVGEVNFGMSAESGAIDMMIDLGSMQLHWFDHWLKGADTGMLDALPIKLFVMGANVWRDEAAWPLARAVPTPYYLRAGGRLSSEAPGQEEPDAYTYDPRNPVPTRGGALLMPPDYPPGPSDQREIEQRPDVLLYTTPPLERDTEVTGPVTVQLWATSSAPDTDFVACLVDVHPDGRSMLLSDGIIRARYRDGIAAPSLIEPGRTYLYEIDLWATSNVFKAGHRIGLHVTSSCFPRWDRNHNTGRSIGADAELRPARQQVLHDHEHASAVVLPIVR